jgi:hypothetical protein
MSPGDIETASYIHVQPPETHIPVDLVFVFNGTSAARYTNSYQGIADAPNATFEPTATAGQVTLKMGTSLKAVSKPFFPFGQVLVDYGEVFEKGRSFEAVCSYDAKRGPFKRLDEVSTLELPYCSVPSYVDPEGVNLLMDLAGPGSEDESEAVTDLTATPVAKSVVADNLAASSSPSSSSSDSSSSSSSSQQGTPTAAASSSSSSSSRLSQQGTTATATSTGATRPANKQRASAKKTGKAAKAKKPFTGGMTASTTNGVPKATPSKGGETKKTRASKRKLVLPPPQVRLLSCHNLSLSIFFQDAKRSKPDATSDSEDEDEEEEEGEEYTPGP